MVMLIAGVVLVLAGLGGAVNACLAAPDDPDFVVAAISGLLLAAGLVLLAVGAGKHGYHYRPLGAPPGDADPDKVSAPPGPSDTSEPSRPWNVSSR